MNIDNKEEAMRAYFKIYDALFTLSVFFDINKLVVRCALNSKLLFSAEKCERRCSSSNANDTINGGFRCAQY